MTKHIRCILLFGAGAMLLAGQGQGQRPNAPPGGNAPPRGANAMRPARPAAEAAAIERGKTAFVAGCGFCHGSSATGGESGPDLVRSVLVLHDEKGDQIGPVILNGRPDKGMPKFAMTAAQISDIAVYLHFRTEEKSNRRDYKIQDVMTGNAPAGEAYFNGAGKCNTCHSASGDLKGVAAKFDPVNLQSRFLYPRTRAFGRGGGAPAGKPTLVTVTLPAGKSISGTLVSIDDFNVSLRDSDGEYHSWLRDRIPGLKIDVKDPLEAHEKLLDQYSDTDMHNLLAYLETLK